MFKRLSLILFQLVWIQVTIFQQLISAKRGLFEYNLHFLMETTNLIRDFFEESRAEFILNHGCWCGKLNNSHDNYENLGGKFSIDRLDKICQHWYKERSRNNNKYGSCAQMHIKQDDFINYSYFLRLINYVGYF